MVKGRVDFPPYDPDGLLAYLDTASERSVGQIELNKLAEVSQLRKRVQADIEEMIRIWAEAMYANWVMQQHRSKPAL